MQPAPTAQATGTPLAAVIEPSTPRTGYLANIAAGGNAALADALGAPVDLATGGINLLTRGVNAVTGAAIPAITDPVGGSGTFKRAMGVVGANPDAVAPGTPGEALVRSATGGAVSAMIPAGVAALAVRTGLAAAPAAEAALNVLGRPTVGNAAVGAAAGVGSDAAAQMAPDQYKPLAGMVGGLVGGVVPAAVGAGAGGIRNALSDYAAPFPFRRNVLAGQDGAPILDTNNQLIRASAAQASAAGQRIIGAATDPAAVRDALAQPVPELVPGSQPTLYQAVPDYGLGQLERTVTNQTSTGPDGKPIPNQALFLARRDAQNNAQVGQLRSYAPAGSDAADLSTGVNAQQAAIAAAGDRSSQAAQTQATALTQGLGGAVPAGGPDAQASVLQQLGDNLRGGLNQQNQAAQAVERGQWKGVTADGNLIVNTASIPNTAQSILAMRSALAAPLEPTEAGIFDAAASMGNTHPVSDLVALRSRITTAMRAEMQANGRSPAYARMSGLLDGVEEAAQAPAEAAGAAAAAPGGQPQAPAPTSPAAADPNAAAAAAPPAPAAAVPVSVPGVGNSVVTPSGQRVGVQYQVVPAQSLVTSHLDDMTPNPAFPPELQPRQRGRAVSEAQVQQIASRLDPTLLGASPTVSDGAPIVGPDGIVESGNGRVMALRRAYQANGPQSQGYQSWLGSQGFDTAGVDQPVLVRRRTTPMTPEQRVAFAGEGSAPTTLAMSAPEQAAQDAHALTPDVLSNLQPGDVAHPANRDFVRSFVRDVAAPNERGSIVTGDGALSSTGAARIRNALMQHAYGDQGLTSALAETVDPAAKVMVGALRDAAGPMAQLKGAIRSGEVDPAVDIAPHLVEATQAVQQARARGISLADAVAQQDAFSRLSEPATALLKAAYGENLAGRMSQEGMAHLLSNYASEAAQQRTTGNLFGANLSRDQILQGAVARYGKDERAAAAGARGIQAVQSSDAAGAGPGVGQNGQGAGRVAASAAGQANARGPAGGGASVLPQPALTPNWTAEAAARYQAARQATAQRHVTFTDAPGVGAVLRPGARSGEWRLGSSQVPAALFSSGKGAAEKVQAFLKASGNRADLASDLGNYAAFSLRRAAETPAGALDPGAYRKWMAQHAEALSVLPEVRSRFATAGEASQRLAEAQTTAREVVESYQRTAASKFLGGQDPVRAVGGILGTRTATQDMGQLAQLTANDPAARAGLQRAVVDHMLGKLRGSGLAGTGDEAERRISSASMQSFLRDNQSALAQVFTPEQVKGMAALGDDLARSGRSLETKLPGGPGTAQDLSLLGLLRQHAGGMGAMFGAGAGAGIAEHSGLAGIAAAAGVEAARHVVTGMRKLGVSQVNDLVTQAALNPGLAHVLVTKIKPANQRNVWRAFGGQLSRAAAVGAAQGSAASAPNQAGATR